jgi:hypothetical protein
MVVVDPVRPRGPAAIVSRVPRWFPVVLFATAFLVRLAPVLRGGGVRGLLGYDDGVYFGAADALWSGRLPYRDFLLLHPPGILLVLAPFAGLAHAVGDPTGFAAARMMFMAVGAVNAVLAYRVAARLSTAAGVAAGLLYAVWEPAMYAERTTLLEPLVNLGLLAALLNLGDVTRASKRQLRVAGVVLGAALAVKLWAVVPLLVLAVWVCRRRGFRDAGVFAASAAASASAVCLPFFLAAPGAMFRMVVIDQLGRPNNGVFTLARLADAAGIGTARETITVLAAVALLAVATVAATIVLRAAPTARVWVALLAAQGTLLLTAPSYYRHYGTYLAPALALIVGAAIAVGVRTAVAYAPRLQPALALIAVVAFLALASAGQRHTSGRPVPTGRIDAALSSAHCVTADSSAVLAVTNVLTRDLRRGCPVAIDFTGATYDRSPDRLPDGRPSVARRADPVWQRYMRASLRAADTVLLAQRPADGLTTATRRWLTHGRRAYADDTIAVYVRREQSGRDEPGGR